MRLLLDTHTLLWWWMNDPFLSHDARMAIRNPDHTVYVSAATGWEIATKVRHGQLAYMRDRLSGFDDHVADEGFFALPVTLTHGVRGGAMAGTHKDPFDRMIAAQALIGDLTVVTRDREIVGFGCKVLW
jgi:PIN domain nuclease of toxin-antitoxin system